MSSNEKILVTLRSSRDDDPFAAQDNQYARDMTQFLSIAESQGGKIVPPRLTMDSVEIQTVLEFAQPLAQDTLKILGDALIAWIHARAGRRTEAKGFGISVKASTPEEAAMLIEKLSELRDSKNPQRDK